MFLYHIRVYNRYNIYLHVLISWHSFLSVSHPFRPTDHLNGPYSLQGPIFYDEELLNLYLEYSFPAINFNIEHVALQISKEEYFAGKLSVHFWRQKCRRIVTVNSAKQENYTATQLSEGIVNIESSAVLD